MKKIILITVLFFGIVSAGLAQGNGNGNGNGNRNGNGNGWGNSNNNNSGNNWGQNGNGNAFGQGNGNGGNNSGGSSNGGGSSSSGSGESAGATQSTHLALSNAIEITFANGFSSTGGDVTLPFTSVNDYANGVESDAQELKVRSNKNFSVAIKTNSANFTYTGNTTPAPQMPVENVLAVKVTGNSTGGSIANPFSTTGYSTLSSSNQDLITAASRGGNQTFSVKYKATPGFAYPAGTYAVDVVYTATQQ